MRILIADDEVLARVGLKSLMNWGKNGYEVIAEAENGSKALALIKEHRPDIVITDIKMPLMDGIELIRTVKSDPLLKSIRFIALSSYDDFLSVKEAMRAGADDYIVKLEMQPEQLLEILRQVSTRIEEERAEQRKSELGRHAKQSLPLLRDKLFKDLLFGWIHHEEELNREAESLGLDLSAGPYVVIAVPLDSSLVYGKYSDQDVHVLDYAIGNILTEVVNDYGTGYVCQTQSKEFSVIFKVEERAASQSVYKLVEAVKGSLKQYLNITVSIGVGSLKDKALEVKRSYQEALEAVSRRFVFPKGSVIHYSDMPEGDCSVENAIPIAEELRLMEQALRTADPLLVESTIARIENQIQNSGKVSKAILQSFCTSLLLLFEHENERQGQSFAAYWGKDPYKELSDYSFLSEYLNWLSSFKSVINDFIARLSESSKMIMLVKQYLNKHYAEEINLEEVAQQFNISKNYLSTLFKKETGTNFIDFLTEIRIEKAKDLLLTTDNKVYEIGQMVGYDNEQYFSRIFKKVTGKPPAQYKY